MTENSKSSEFKLPGVSEGHRERLRQRFLAGEADALTDEAILELLLSYAILRCDVQGLAKSLLEQFGSLQSILAADPAVLRKIKGIKDSTISLLKLSQHLAKGMEEGPVTLGEPGSLAIEQAATAAAPAADQVLRLGQEEGASLSVKSDKSGETAASERKLQVSNGYLLDAAQLARLLSFIDSKPQAKKISSAELIDGSGLSARQVENLVSMGSALGLIIPRTQLLTQFGRLVAKNDLFLDSAVTLEFCHFLAAGRQRNLVWFEVFNELLATQPPMTQPEWCVWLREKLTGHYSDRSLVKHVAHEVRFIIDAYTARNFKKLGLLTESPEKTYTLRRHAALQPLTLAAMIYMVGERTTTRLVPFADLHSRPGSPGRLFALDSATLRQAIETLHQREWLRFEVRHGLDQLRLIEGFDPLEFIGAAYENRAPQLRAATTAPTSAQLLL